MRLAKVISYLLHPLWMPLFTLVLAYLLDPFLSLRAPVFNFLLIVLFVNTIAPGISILVMQRRGLISDLEIRNKQERFVPFILFLFYYALSYALIRFRGNFIPQDVMVIFSSLLVSLSLGLILTLKTKVSMHLMAIGGLCGVLAGLNRIHLLGIGEVVTIVFLLAGALGWARIRMRVHTHTQVYLGFLIGFFIHYLMLVFRIYL